MPVYLRKYFINKVLSDKEKNNDPEVTVNSNKKTQKKTKKNVV